MPPMLSHWHWLKRLHHQKSPRYLVFRVLKILEYFLPGLTLKLFTQIIHLRTCLQYIALCLAGNKCMASWFKPTGLLAMKGGWVCIQSSSRTRSRMQTQRGVTFSTYFSIHIKQSQSSNLINRQRKHPMRDKIPSRWPCFPDIATGKTVSKSHVHIYTPAARNYISLFFNKLEDSFSQVPFRFIFRYRQVSCFLVVTSLDGSLGH